MDRVAVVIERLAVHPHPLAGHAHPIARQSDHAFDEMLGRIQWVAKNNDVSAADLAIGKQLAPSSAPAVMDFIHQQVVADQQSLLHGFRGDLEGLRQKGYVKERDDHRQAQPLREQQPAGDSRRLSPARNRGRGRDCGHWRRFDDRLKAVCALKDLRLRAPDVFRLPGWLWRLTHSEFPVICAAPCRCSSASLAARCSAIFLLGPSARAT